MGKRLNLPISRVQLLIVALLLAIAVAFAIPAMHDSNIEKMLRGECKLAPIGWIGNWFHRRQSCLGHIEQPPERLPLGATHRSD